MTLKPQWSQPDREWSEKRQRLVLNVPTADDLAARRLRAMVALITTASGPHATGGFGHAVGGGAHGNADACGV